MKYILVQWPESQELMDINGFDEHSTLADADFAGSAAYFVEEDWLNEATGTPNKIQELQTELNHAVHEVFERFLKSGKCYDFSLNKEVGDEEICGEHYCELVCKDDDEEVLDRIESNCPWNSESLDSDGSDSALCIGVMSYGERAYATFYDMDNGDVYDKQIWGFNADVASRVLGLMSKED